MIDRRLSTAVVEDVVVTDPLVLLHEWQLLSASTAFYVGGWCVQQTGHA